MLHEAARDGLSAPVNLTWEMTLTCNLQCSHCLSSAGRPMSNELTTEECCDVIDELSALKVFQVNIGGGEPFVRPDFFPILEYAQKKGIVTCVSTNGTLLDTESCARLADMEGLFLQVSLDGVDEETNDQVRGKGTYRKILQAAEELAGRQVEFSINAVLIRKNFEQLDDLKRLAASFGANLRVSRFRPSGRGKRVYEELAPTKDQLETFALWLEQDSTVLTGDSFFSLTSEKRRRMGLDMCGAAKMTCCLSPNGDIYPCAFLQEGEFRAGNIRDASLEETWLNSSILNHFRTLEVHSCEWCYRFETCRGGCPAIAYHTSNDLSSPDPECLQCIKKRTAQG